MADEESSLKDFKEMMVLDDVVFNPSLASLNFF
jgi:hypothetical protein